MKKKIIISVIVLIQIIILILSFVLGFRREPVQIQFNSTDFLYDAGNIIDDEIYIDENDTDTVAGIYTLPMSLSKGTYKITFFYEAGEDNCTYDFVEAGYPYYAFEFDRNLSLNYTENVQTAYLKVAAQADNFQVKILYNGQGSFSLKGIEVVSVNSAVYCELLQLVIFIVLADILLWVLYKKSQKVIFTGEKSAFLPVFLVGILASLPLFSDYLIQGHDLSFHLLRIEGIKDALLSGQFPVRIHPVQFDGYGYATAIYYPEIFLYFPAILRMLGYSVMDAYKIFLFSMNMVTAGIAYFSFSKICDSKRAGICGSVLYTLSLYRLINVYFRSALGESLAMTFIPLVMLGIFYILMSDGKEREKRRKGILSVTVGLTGILQSHILSCEMIGLVCVILAVVYFGKIIKQRRWLDIIISGVFTLMLNIWFLVPFLLSMRENIMVKASSDDIAGQALNPVQLFFPLSEVAGSNENLLNGMADEMPFGIGFVMTLSILIIILGMHNWRTKDYKVRFGFGFVCFILGLTCLWMTTTWFPWIQVNEIGGLVAKIMNIVQYPWRYIGPATILLIVAILFFIKDTENKKIQNIIGLVLMIIAVLTSCLFAQKLYENGAVYRVYNEEGVENLTFGATEYLYNGTQVENIIPADELIEMQTHITSFVKTGSNMDISINNATQDAKVCYLPAFYYPSYVAYDVNTNEKIILERALNGNNIIQFTVPAGYQGSIHVRVQDSVLWQCSNWISLISLVLIFCFFRKEILYKKRI